jgi:hypothetical protein
LRELFAAPLALPKTAPRQLNDSKVKSLSQKYATIPAEFRDYFPQSQPAAKPAPKAALLQRRGPGRPPGSGLRQRSQVVPGQSTLSAFMSQAKRPRLDAAVGETAIDVEAAAEEEESEELEYASDVSEAFLP